MPTSIQKSYGYSISRGMITRATLGLITMPLILIKIIIPAFLLKINRPLTFYAHTHVPRLIVCLLIAIFIFFGKHLQFYPTIFYVVLVILLGLGEVLNCVQATTRGAFLAYISDTRIGSSYYTLVASLSNCSYIVSSSVVLHVAYWLPEEYAYFIEVGICLIYGCLWFCMSFQLMHRLQVLPVESWYLMLHLREHDEDDQQHQNALISNKERDSPTVAANTESSCSL